MGQMLCEMIFCGKDAAKLDKYGLGVLLLGCGKDAAKRGTNRSLVAAYRLRQ